MTLLLAALLYLGIGAGLGMTALRLPALRRRIAAVAAGRGMDLGYARAVWL
ncbi:MAG: hypothetical protein HC871_11415, partial [Rhizobiales bacterium]|nr:hypothetical protein [Hyphomicrobiales bacterium]